MSTSFALFSSATNVGVTGIFAAVVLRQYLRRHRSYQLYWCVGLLMAFIATLAYVFMLRVQPTSYNGIILFHTYYILGVLTPAWLGLGSVALISSPRATTLWLTFLYVLSGVTTALVLLAKIDMNKLSQIVGPGTGILQPGPWLVAVIIVNTLGVVAVVGVAIYSGLKLYRRQRDVAGFRTSNILWANVLILAGDLINAGAGTVARTLGIESGFWILMALGWIVFFVGVLLASRRPVTTNAEPAKDVKDAEKRLTSSNFLRR
ncbi:MAG: hypothetical protein NVSMB49_25970 [Ktedonobacteraceae bacterium]